MTDTPTPPSPDQRTRGRLMVVLALVVGLGAGLGAAALLSRDDDSAGPTDGTEDTPSGEVGDGDPEANAELPPSDPVIAVTEATTPEAAIRGFLAAEAAGEWETSYAFLTSEVQELVHTSPAAWVNAHADSPTPTGYRVDEVSDAGDGTAVAETLTGYEPIVDPVIGLVPARARTTWALEEAEDGTWRVDIQNSQLVPLFPSSTGAADAAERWVDARVECQDSSDLEAGLVGSPALASSLCDASAPELGTVGRLTDSSETTPLVSEFGPEVFGWARTVRVEAETPFLAVLAPLGEEWKVVGIIRAL